MVGPDDPAAKRASEIVRECVTALMASGGAAAEHINAVIPEIEGSTALLGATLAAFTSYAGYLVSVISENNGQSPEEVVQAVALSIEQTGFTF